MIYVQRYLVAVEDIANKFKRLNRGKFNIFINDRRMDIFQRAAHDPDGLEKSIDVLFDMLISGGGFLSQSLFEHSPQYCTESHKSYFIGKISQAIELYRIAHVLDFKGKIDPDLEKGWNVKYLRAEAAYVKHCTVCPFGYYLDDPKHRKLSQLIGMLPKSGQDKLKNVRKIFEMDGINDVTREKLKELLYDVTNFDPNENAIR